MEEMGCHSWKGELTFAWHSRPLLRQAPLRWRPWNSMMNRRTSSTRHSTWSHEWYALLPATNETVVLTQRFHAGSPSCYVVYRLDHQATGGDLEGTHVPHGWGEMGWCWSAVGGHPAPITTRPAVRLSNMNDPTTLHKTNMRTWRYPQDQK